MPQHVLLQGVPIAVLGLRRQLGIGRVAMEPPPGPGRGAEEFVSQAMQYDSDQDGKLAPEELSEMASSPRQKRGASTRGTELASRRIKYCGH